MAGEAMIGASEKVAQEQKRVWDLFRKWLEQQAKGTIGALILIIYYGVKDGIIYWKNRPQIIELGKDSPMDAVTKASILALEKDKVVDSAVIKMNREVNKLIRKIAKKAGIDVIMQEVPAMNGEKAWVIAYTGKNKQQLEHFIQVLESYPVIRNALLLTPDQYKQLADMTEIKRLQLRDILVEHALAIVKDPNIDLQTLRGQTAKKIKEQGIIDYDDPSSPINYMELASSKGFLASIEKILKRDLYLESTVSFDTMAKAEQQRILDKIVSLSEDFASQIVTSYNLSKVTDMNFYHKQTLDLLEENATEPQVAYALNILSQNKVLANPYHSVYEAISKAIKGSQKAIAEAKGSKKDKQKAIAVGIASVLAALTNKQLMTGYPKLTEHFKKAIQKELSTLKKSPKFSKENSIAVKKGELSRFSDMERIR